MAGGFDLADEFKNAYRQFILSRGVEEEKADYFLFLINKFVKYLKSVPLSEVEYLILLTTDLDMLSQNTYCDLTSSVIEIKRMLATFIKKLRADR